MFGSKIVDKTAVLNLSNSEIENVNHFIQNKDINSYKLKILFEFAPTSGQSKVDYYFAIEIAKRIIAENKNVCFILTGNKRKEFGE